MSLSKKEKKDPGEALFSSRFEEMIKLGNGAHGEVKLIRDRRTMQLMCGKYIPYSELEDLFAAIHEFKLVKSLSHENIIKYSEFYLLDSSKKIIIVCEYLNNMTSLKDFLKQRIPLDEAKLKRLMKELLTGLRYLHARGVCHRDISLGNILFSPSFMNPSKIIDFGTAFHFKEHKRTQRDDMDLGKPSENRLIPMHSRATFSARYIAPEILEGNYDKEIDTYSLCSILLDCCLRPKLTSIPDFFETKSCDFSTVTTTESFRSIATPELAVKKPVHLKSKRELVMGIPFSDKLKDFLDKALNPKRELRMTAEDLENHPWLLEKRRRTKMRINSGGFKAKIPELERPQILAEVSQSEMDQYVREVKKILSERDGKMTQGLVTKGEKLGIFLNSLVK